MNAMDETEIIDLFLAQLPKDPGRISPFFASDAEILACGAGRLLFTIDSFDEEDHFRTDDAYTLGWNIAACTVSDIFACGGTVEYYGHSATVSERWDAGFISSLSKGIADVITTCGGRFAGGDLGCARNWHYTGVALGSAERPVTRAGARPGDVLYISGPVGAGNFEAAATLLEPPTDTDATSVRTRARFPLRQREARLVAEFASACIDTSDGLLRALQIIAEINGTGFDVGPIPYFPAGLALLQSLGLPEELLMAGECGEYELLCCIPPDRERAFLDQSLQTGTAFHRIGIVTENGTALLRGCGPVIDLADYILRARQYTDHRIYVGNLTQYFLTKLANT